MAKETVHGTNMMPNENVADLYSATDAFVDGGIDVSGGFNPKDGKGAQALPTQDVSAGDDGQFNYVDNKFDSAPWTDPTEAEGTERPTLPRIEEVGSVPNPETASWETLWISTAWLRTSTRSSQPTRTSRRVTARQQRRLRDRPCADVRGHVRRHPGLPDVG